MGAPKGKGVGFLLKVRCRKKKKRRKKSKRKKRERRKKRRRSLAWLRHLAL